MCEHVLEHAPPGALSILYILMPSISDLLLEGAHNSDLFAAC